MNKSWNIEGNWRAPGFAGITTSQQWRSEIIIASLLYIQNSQLNGEGQVAFQVHFLLSKVSHMRRLIPHLHLPNYVSYLASSHVLPALPPSDALPPSSHICVLLKRFLIPQIIHHLSIWQMIHIYKRELISSKIFLLGQNTIIHFQSRIKLRGVLRNDSFVCRAPAVISMFPIGFPST
jgi:hypothetical protein